MSRNHLIALIVALVVATVALSPCPLPAGAAEMRTLYPADIRMKDGVRLAADVYLPPGEGKYPAILLRTPYQPRSRFVTDFAARLTGAGYAVVVGHCRGRFDSPGEFRPFEREARDSYKTVDWVVKQEWSNGDVATMGASYLGMIQWQLAALQHPAVKAMFILVAPSNLYRDVIFPGGAYALQNVTQWLFTIARRTDQNLELTSWPQVFRHLPVMTVDEAIGCRLPTLREYLRHSRFGPFWRKIYLLEGIYDRVNVPVFIVGGWNDPMVRGTLDSFAGLKASLERRNERHARVECLIGPWDHLGAISGLNTVYGDVDYGPEARVDVDDLARLWFDRWLKNRAPEKWQEKPLRYFVPGTARWYEDTNWPPHAVEERILYLRSSGSAGEQDADGVLSRDAPSEPEPADKYKYDPATPVPSVMSQHVLFGSGPKRINDIEKRRDVLVYTAEPFSEDTVVAGNPRVVLHFSSDAPDTDFSAWLTDVSPDGTSLAIQDGIVRVSRYLGGDSDSPLRQGQRYLVEIELGSVAHLFKAGQRVRIDISSSNFPAFDRNLNTGGDNAAQSEGRPASQQIFHSPDSSSHLILPVLLDSPPDKRETGHRVAE